MSANQNSEAEASATMDLSDDRAERIRLRAYELYEAHGRDAGHDLDNWLQAQAEIEASESGPKEHGV